MEKTRKVWGRERVRRAGLYGSSRQDGGILETDSASAKGKKGGRGKGAGWRLWAMGKIASFSGTSIIIFQNRVALQQNLLYLLYSLYLRQDLA